ncbi:HNH endonuclease [Streptomyces sp. SAT1]|uniref:HNH endonuclease n=1 Tax=Streptomyces sp. SAT1 TaxID=1849967 RepID=UPI001F25B88A|nr:HNH endonuclease [Streptomyces sp. SAT1]
MGLGDVTRAGVLAAVEECRSLGREAFRRRYGFGRAAAYELVLDGHRYDSKAIVGVAHLYSVGDLLQAADFSGGARTVAHRLRALGFAVEDKAAVEEPTQALPQMVLQPRGTARDRGPRNFAKSVRQGIRITDIKDVLGDQADVLGNLYRDGVARLWGSTPTTQTNNEKVRALRNRRVGDDVFFYAENHFIARARILHLFDSAPVAQAVWGTDDGDATWEHIMALGDIEEFRTRVFAAPVLRSLNIPVPLRTLALRSSEDYRRVVPFFPERSRSATAKPPVAPPAQPSRLTSAQLLERFGSLNTHRHPENKAPSRHQPLALLWAVARIATGKPRLTPWASFRAEVGPLLAEFGLPGFKVTPEYPFWHLRGSGMWEVHGMANGTASMPQVGMFNTVQPVAGLTSAAAELLQNPMTRLEAVVKLCGTYLADVDRRQLLGRAGLEGYATADGLPADSEDGPGGDGGADETAGTERSTGPAARRDVSSSRPVRDPAIVSKVKRLHGNACQVCGACLWYKSRPYSEAAHIRGLGSPHDGPDELQNLLCLCPNHHVLFDGLEIYIDVDDMVKWTRDGEPLRRLRRHGEHQIDETYLQYHRTLCELNGLTMK